MDEYIVKVAYNKTSLIKPVESFRIPAIDELDAKRKCVRHPYYPKDGEIISVKKAAYRKIKQ